MIWCPGKRICPACKVTRSSSISLFWKICISGTITCITGARFYFWYCDFIGPRSGIVHDLYGHQTGKNPRTGIESRMSRYYHCPISVEALKHTISGSALCLFCYRWLHFQNCQLLFQYGHLYSPRSGTLPWAQDDCSGTDAVNQNNHCRRFYGRRAATVHDWVAPKPEDGRKWVGPPNLNRDLATESPYQKCEQQNQNANFAERGLTNQYTNHDTLLDKHNEYHLFHTGAFPALVMKQWMVTSIYKLEDDRMMTDNNFRKEKMTLT